jgi:hypothetical protein
MTSPTPDCLTARHLELFGTIVQWFAHYELLVQDVMAAIAGADAAAIMLLTRRLDFAEKRRALLDLMRHRPIPMDQSDRIHDFLAIPDKLTGLRNDIAHSAWIPGAVATGVQPNWVLRIPSSVKPSRGDAAIYGSYVEDPQEEVEYTLDDLSQIAATLAGNYALFLSYLQEKSLTPRPA